MAALHNATLLRRALPIALTVPRPLYLDRKAHHTNIAATLRVSQVVKRARTQEKRKATIAAKALKKPAGGEAREDPNIDIRSGDEESDEDEDEPTVTSKKRKRTKTV